MPPSSKVGTPTMAAMLMDPRANKTHLINGQGRASQPAMAPTAPCPQSSISPIRSLDPKGSKAPRYKQYLNPIRSNSPDTAPRSSESEESEAQGMGSLIERVHGITQREERPRKRQKTEIVPDDAQKEVTFQGGGKGTEIGEYMREKRREAQANSGPDETVIDLTAGDDDDVVVVRDSQDKEVCYGMLNEAKVNAHLIPNPSSKANYQGRSQWPAMKLKLHRLPGRDHIIRVLDPTDKDFGNVDVRTSQGLARLMDSRNPKIRVQARLNIRNKAPNETAGQPCSAYFDMFINIYGPKSRAAAVGQWLGSKNLWLRTPTSADPGIETCNPHIREAIKPKSAGNSAPREAYVYRTIEETRNEVVGMFDSLESSEDLPEMEADERIITPLLKHQKQGLYFMMKKEEERVFSDKEEDNSSLWRLKYKPNGRRVYYNIITGREENTKPPEVLGGILADMMGLGKTLSILTLVVSSLDQTAQWVTQEPPELEEMDIPLDRNAKTTLLIAPLSTINNWEEQIQFHVKDNTIRYYVYHGNNRLTNLDELGSYDMIITTYSIISSEYSRRSKKRDISPLFQLNFFRIVLDEAHMIREQATMQSQAVCKLSAQRRWAVTGTPVQNRLDDLGALIKFLRMKPFEKNGFAQFILSPFKNADPEILPKLRLLVDSITLRRAKEKINLPPREDKIVRLKFTEEEALLYDWFMKDSNQKVRAIAGGHRQSLGGKTYVHILRAILRLRLICAHGRELLSEEDLKMTEGFNASNAIDLSDEEDEHVKKVPVMNPRHVYEMLMLFKETDADTCASCARKIAPKEDEDSSALRDNTIGYMLPCFQLICRDCSKDTKSTIEERSVDGRFSCPFCDQYVRGAMFELTQSGIEAAEESKAKASANPRHSKIMARYGGPHTKTKALVAALLFHKEESKHLRQLEQPPIKSVVFSGWTSHLDLIQIALDDAGLSYVRLDGQMTRQKRNASLDAFRDDPDTTIILISLMAGGLGLNLTTASKVYVMEPQFNPAAEAQAVDRVHRLGQKRSVTTVRFIMEGSFEENVLRLQQKKKNLADLSMNRGKLDKAEAAKQRMEELRSLFR